MSSEAVGYQDVTITATTATREGIPGTLTLRYALSAVPLSWEGHFEEAYKTTAVAPATLTGLEGRQIVLTMRETNTTDQTLATVRQDLERAISAANHQTQAYLAASARVEQGQQEHAQGGAARLSRVQDILDKQ